MYRDFNPDYIVGSNVSYNAELPMEDDLISQLTNMLVSYSKYELPCDYGVMIQPETSISTFDFESVEEAIAAGYLAANKYLDSIEIHVERRISKEELDTKRQQFRSKIIPVSVSSISTNNNRKRDLNYVRSSMIRLKKNEIIELEKLEKRYFRLYATPQIDFIYPVLNVKKDSTYNLNLEVRKAKDFKLSVGGHFSSRAVNTGYIGVDFRSLGRTASTIHASSYFGKFYGSAKLNYTLEIPSTFPISLSTYFVMNRWDYFRSFATFFEDVQPSFLVQNEMYYGAKLLHPIGNTTKSTLDIRLFNLEDDYYQTSNFTNKDTSDITKFSGLSGSWEFEKNSLNHKQYSNSGHLLKFKSRYVYGKELSIPGSTSTSDSIRTHFHSWINLSAEFQSFIIDKPHFHLGLYGKGVFNSQSLFTNYTASLLSMTSFSPIPDAETFFLPEYRSPQFVGVGLTTIFTIKKNIDIRLDGYFFQPFVTIQQNNDGTPTYSKPFKGDTYMASASFIYHSFIGPVRATLNYFPKQTLHPFAFQVSYGFVLFNERAIR